MDCEQSPHYAGSNHFAVQHISVCGQLLQTRRHRRHTFLRQRESGSGGASGCLEIVCALHMRLGLGRGRGGGGVAAVEEINIT